MPGRALAFASVLLVAGCGGGGGGGDDVGGTGSLTVSFTDSPAHDVARFTFDVTDITLTSTEASVAKGLNHPITIDVATLNRSSQVLSIQGIDGGHYTTASITLDFSNSECFLVDKTAQASLLDDDGNALSGTVTRTIDLSATPVVVQDGGRYEFELDFDLDQSLAIDDAANSVSVSPSIVVRTNRTDPHLNVAVGALTAVDVNGMTAAIDLETPTRFSLGPARLNFSSATIFQVDGTPSTGFAGVQALAAELIGTWVQAFVAVDPASGSAFIAYVEAGTGTFNGGQALIEGVIVDRGDTAGGNKLLTVHGRSTSADHATELFDTDFQVTVTPGTPPASTRVVRDSSNSTAFRVESLNVGQRVQVFGTLSGTAMDATPAKAGLVRAEPTSLFAFANSAPSGGTLSVDLLPLAPLVGRVEEIGVVSTTTPFAWGDDDTVTRDPNQFAVDVSLLGTLPILGLGDAVRMNVYLSKIGFGPPDATAFTIEKILPTSQLLALRDRSGGLTLDTQVNGTQIDFTVTNVGSILAGERAALDAGLLGVDALTEGQVVKVGPGASAVFYSLQTGAGTVTTFKTFGDFVTAFGNALGGGSTVKDFTAAGSFDTGSGTLSATTVTALLQ